MRQNGYDRRDLTLAANPGAARLEQPLSTDTSWRLLMSAFEPTPGEWWLRDANQFPYAIIRMVRRGDEVGYRAVTYAERSADRELIGYYRRLAPAAVAAHERHLRSMITPPRSPR